MIRLALVIVLFWYGCVNWAFGAALFAAPISVSPTTEAREQARTLFIVTADGKVTIYATEAELHDYLETLTDNEERGIIMMAIKILQLQKAQCRP